VTTEFGPMAVIADGSAGRGAVRSRIPEVTQTLTAKGFEFHLIETAGAARVQEAARDAMVSGHRFVVVVGDDRSIHHAVNGMIDQDAPIVPDAVLGVVAAGSGADFVQTFGLPGDVAGACAHLEGPNVFPIDVGRVANCQYYGGGMRISPRSWPGDGLLDVVIMTGPKSESFTLLPSIYRGEHLPHPHIVEMKARSLHVETDLPWPVEADGMPLGTTPATFEIIRQPIRLKI
jgi:diacylglycerol kinase family enzyme